MARDIAWVKGHPLEAVFYASILGCLLVPLGAVILYWQVALAGMVCYCIVAGVAAWAYLPDKNTGFKILGCVMVATVVFGIFMAIELVRVSI